MNLPRPRLAAAALGFLALAAGCAQPAGREDSSRVLPAAVDAENSHVVRLQVPGMT